MSNIVSLKAEMKAVHHTGVSVKNNQPYDFWSVYLNCNGVDIELKTTDKTAQRLLIKFLEQGGDK